MVAMSRRVFALSACGIAGTASFVSGCSSFGMSDEYEALASQIRQPVALPIKLPVTPLEFEGNAPTSELVRYATLAPSSHNTQCWKFSATETSITLLPDLARRCPAVDPDDHHLFVSLGCATENLVQAALAHGLHADVVFDDIRENIRVELRPTAPRSSALFHAIPLRQVTRGDYDGAAVSAAELDVLQRVGSGPQVRLVLLTGRPALEHVLGQIIGANSRQMADAGFVAELKTWVRFNASDAVLTRDGLFSPTSGNPAIPGWLGRLAFGMLFTPVSENDKIARQIRSSAGIAVFVGLSADKAHWVEVGRCYERFALQATALGIRNAHLNQPVEVPSSRSSLARALGLDGYRPDLVVRFGRGPTMPFSLRRPVSAVMV